MAHTFKLPAVLDFSFLEWRNSKGKHHRASQELCVTPFPDGTTLSFSGGTVSLAGNEWFRADLVGEIFNSFSSGAGFPPWLSWRELSSEYTSAS